MNAQSQPSLGGANSALGESGRTYRPGLDGLRALSVIAVLLYHGEVSWLPGGFLGVEVFFVVSGYLITSLLIDEYWAERTISARGFWLRRARRLLAALYVMLIATAAVVAAFYRDELFALRPQVAAALTYCTNWYLALADQSYFAMADRPSPLQHLWSLAVEEQFYLVWPLVLLVLLRVSGARKAPLAIVLAIGAAASALWMAVLYDPTVDPSRVYYGTDTRASGLLLGALVAVVWRQGAIGGRHSSTRSAMAMDVLGVGGIVVLLVCFAQIRELDPFLYRGGFVLVALASAAVVVAVVQPRSVFGRFALGHPVLAWIGLRSYALYLWHWPVFVFTRPGIDVSWGTWPTLAFRLALTAVLAELSYRFVERPVRNGILGRWLAAMRNPPARPRVAHRWVLVGAGATTVIVVLLTGLTVVRATRPIGDVERSIRFGQPAAPPTSPRSAVPSTALPVPTSAVPAKAVPGKPAPSRPAPSRPPPTTVPARRAVTVLSDSVLLGAKLAMVDELSAAGWQVDYRGSPATMIKEARRQLDEEATRVGPVVIVGLGYNSLWEKDRQNFERWSDLFDREVDELVSTLEAHGAQTVLWVTLREPSPDVVPADGESQLKKYAWYFPYVNERLRVVPKRHPDVALADWAAVSNKPDLTYDAIHLNSRGVRLMIDTIRRSAGI